MKKKIVSIETTLVLCCKELLSEYEKVDTEEKLIKFVGLLSRTFEKSCKENPKDVNDFLDTVIGKFFFKVSFLERIKSGFEKKLEDLKPKEVSKSTILKQSSGEVPSFIKVISDAYAFLLLWKVNDAESEKLRGKLEAILASQNVNLKECVKEYLKKESNVLGAPIWKLKIDDCRRRICQDALLSDQTLSEKVYLELIVQSHDELSDLTQFLADQFFSRGRDRVAVLANTLNQNSAEEIVRFPVWTNRDLNTGSSREVIQAILMNKKPGFVFDVAMAFDPHQVSPFIAALLSVSTFEGLLRLRATFASTIQSELSSDAFTEEKIPQLSKKLGLLIEIDKKLVQTNPNITNRDDFSRITPRSLRADLSRIIETKMRSQDFTDEIGLEIAAKIKLLIEMDRTLLEIYPDLNQQVESTGKNAVSLRQFFAESIKGKINERFYDDEKMKKLAKLIKVAKKIDALLLKERPDLERDYDFWPLNSKALIHQLSANMKMREYQKDYIFLIIDMSDHSEVKKEFEEIFKQ